MKKRTRRDELSVGSGHDGAWVVCVYRYYLRGLEPRPEVETIWHDGGWEFDSTGGVYSNPSLSLPAQRLRTAIGVRGNMIALARRAPCKMNQLREIDIMDGWLPAKVPYTHDET